MKNISVVNHSGYGHTTNQANGIVSGIDSVENVAANLIAIDKGSHLRRLDGKGAA